MIQKTREDWLKELTDEEFHVLFEKGTEPPFVGEYTDNEAVGTYSCKACGEVLFLSQHKYHSGCGWPSFYKPEHNLKIKTAVDNSILGRPRTEIMCANCGGHLGHVFEDGPADETGLRYCVNSISLKFNT